MSHIKRLHRLGKLSISNGKLLNAPNFVTKQLQYEVIMGSFAYGCSSDMSDTDIYGFCIPPKAIIFPHTNPNYIHGFDPVPHNFEQFQPKDSIIDSTVKPPREYDISIYNIVKYFRLCMEGNPNMIDSLFVPRRCITYMSPIGELVRENRHLFLSKKCWHTFKGYAYSQLHKMNTKNPTGKRKATVEKYGYDIKFGYHLVRLLDEIRQILSTGDLDIERNREQLKSVRRGEWDKAKIEQYFDWNEKALEQLVNDSKLPHKPRRDEIRELLFKCLKLHWQTLNGCREPENVSGDLYHAIMDTLNQFEGKVFI